MRGQFLLIEIAAGHTKGFNPDLVSHFETIPDGGALLHLIGGKHVELGKKEWQTVAPHFLNPEPQGAANTGGSSAG